MNTFFKRCLVPVLLLVLHISFAAEVDTLLTKSTAMNKNIKAVVITPKGYSKKQHYPVMYLLHGYSGNYKDWLTKVEKLKDLVDQHNIIVVCPDGNYGSWYFDSPEGLLLNTKPMLARSW